MSSKKVQILYKDSSEVYAPLSHLYFSSSSKILISRFVDNVSEEILTSFCPQCFTRYFDSDDVSKQHGGKVCATCSNCPHCQGVMVKTTATDCPNRHLQCSNCQWEYHQTEDKLDSEFATASAYYDHLNKYFNKKAVVACKDGQEESTGSRRWQLSDLERKLGAMEHLKFEDPYSLWFESNPQIHTQAASLLPVPTRLVNKRTLRCQQDLDNSRMNLLVLPKTMPLEGDSSQIINKGKWFDKNASACFTLPILTLLHLPTPICPYLIYKLANHTDKKLDCVFYTTCTESINQSNYMVQDANTGAFEFVSSLPVLVEYLRYLPTPPTPTHSLSPSTGTVTISLEEYEDDLLKEDFTPRDRTKYYPPIPQGGGEGGEEGKGDGSTPSKEQEWKVVIQSNLAYVYIPVSSQLCDISSFEMHMTYDLCVHEAAGGFTLPIDLTVRVE
ncbi:hypothetical protein EON65_35150 [archaeon]|nr:MAG: hypothetical protein EON65_35150 [archaeon]